MKNILPKACLAIASVAMLASCKKFEDINRNPLAVDESQVQTEYFINSSIIGAQQDPHVAERAFVLYWKTAGRQQSAGGISSGGYDDGWSSDYYGGSYMSGWLNSANTAIEVAETQIGSGIAKTYTPNLMQVARIWRAYLMSELSDNFGPIPINGFQGVNPEFSSVKDVYYFLLAELKDASGKLDLSVTNPATLAKLDPAFGYNYAKWQKYANSMRLRLAMRLSEVDATKAKAEFEDAADEPIIMSMDETFQVAEKPGGWDALAGVMSREWNAQLISVALNNLYLNFGGITSQSQLPDSLHPYVKAANYKGLRFDDHFTTMTNDPSAGYWLDGLPAVIDPRAYKTFIIPGQFSNPDFSRYPGNAALTTSRNLLNPDGSVLRTIDARFNWNAAVSGDWDTKGAKNQLRAYEGTMPRMSQRFRASTSSRIFFAPWETHFLIAEAAVRGWTVPMTGKAAYEKGIEQNFGYWGVTNHLATYLTSTSYNRAGTSVSWDHVAEPPATYAMNYVNGYTNVAGVVNVPYAKNDLYMNGAVKNDLLTKIITQKFIAHTPWLPLEGWNEKRRTGLPFFENPAIERPLPNLPALTSSNYMTSNVKFFPQRLRYPSGLAFSNATGYQQALSFLGGPDAVLTPLWWAKQ